MYFIEVHDGIQKIIKGYFQIGFWHQGDKATVKETSVKLFYSIYYTLYPFSLLAGAITSDTKNESMFLVEVATITTVMLMRLLYIIWRQRDIYELIYRIGAYSIKDEDDFTVTDIKLKSFMKWITYFYYYVFFAATCVGVAVPLIGGFKQLFLNIGFPLDYKNNDFAFWIAFLFVLTEVFISASSVSFNIIIWYLLYNCGLKYKVLGSELRNMGVIRTVDAAVNRRNVFHRNLIAGIKSHKYIIELTKQLESLIFNLLSVQLGTSVICICTSVYILAINYSKNIMELNVYFCMFFYNIFDIFMVMYFGNEIKLSSDGLSYCLFKSNWMEQSQSCKKKIIVFGERLKQAHQLLVLQIYPLTLETFTKILNAAYSSFNVLKTST